jgi:hypothetical protein
VSRLVAAAFVAAALAGCGKDTTPLCRPSTVEECWCDTGGPGEQVCNDKGDDYGDCTCLPEDAGVDAEAIDGPLPIDAEPPP